MKRQDSGVRFCMPSAAGKMKSIDTEQPVRSSDEQSHRACNMAGWFESRGWKPFGFQLEAWQRYRDGESGLITVPTGAGKTYAAVGGALDELIAEARAGTLEKGLRLLYVTPLRAVSRDIELALKLPLHEMGVLAGERVGRGKKGAAGGVTVESRTGDTGAALRAKQGEELPHALVTTPESLSLMLSRKNAVELLGGVRCVVLDEWHELLSSKRGTQVELAMAHVRDWAPRVRTWALSATIGNVEEAALVACGVAIGVGGGVPRVIRGAMERPVVIESLLPKSVDELPWAGHMGMAMLGRLIEWLDPEKSTLIFTNTRSQAEKWFQAISFAKPEWAGVLALHHGSIDREERERIEAGLKDGTVRLVVATSSLDLGVDFSQVERVVQIGSVKGIARLLQRAGRANHQPGESSRVLCVPTHGLELLEIDAARRGVASGEMEERRPVREPLDVLAQHVVTVGVGPGFRASEMLATVRRTWSYQGLSEEEFARVLSMVREGGGTLKAYPEYHKVEEDGEGVYRVTTPRLAHLHRLNIGTITGDGTLEIRLQSGKRLGNIEESFISRLGAGDAFFFAGRMVEFVALRELTAIVRMSKKRSTLTPIWGGTRLPISESLGAAVRESLEKLGGLGSDEEELGVGELGAELRCAAPLGRAQRGMSAVPRRDQTLVEVLRTREGEHLFVYPFAGRLVHAGLGALLALRMGRNVRTTFAIAQNDYGFEVLAEEGYPFAEMMTKEIFSTRDLAVDVAASVELSALAKLQFREIARISGLVFQQHPGARKSSRQLQASSGLIFDVFSEFDPENILLMQARKEVLERQFEESRLARTMQRIAEGELVVRMPRSPTPLGLPLVVERLGARLSTETVLDRVRKMKEEWGRAAMDLEGLGKRKSAKGRNT